MHDLEDSRQRGLDDAKRWMDAADAVDQLLIRAILFAWMRKHARPGGFVNVGLTIDAFPGFIRTAEMIRAKMPKAAVRKIMRESTVEAFIGDLLEGHPDQSKFPQRITIGARVIGFRCRLWLLEVVSWIREP